MRNLDDVGWLELKAVVAEVRDCLWGVQDDDARELLDPEKEWSPDTLDEIAEIFVRRGLSPEQTAPPPERP